MPSADDFRRYAAECVSLAQRMSDPADRAHMLQMAQAWRDLADKLESKAKETATSRGTSPESGANS
jgi:hypothetical protein